MSSRFERLQKIAPQLDRLREDPNARVHYELMSDSLVWSDELPPLDEFQASDSSVLRGVWRYRTSLIMGVPEEKCRPAWEEAQKLFPNWPGFLPQRQLPSWREFFIERQAKLSDHWEELDARYRRQMAEAVAKSAAV